MNVRIEIPDDEFEKAVETVLGKNPDYVLVVRCEDCKWRDEDDVCTHEWLKDYNGFGTYVKLSGFCNFGERTTDHSREGTKMVEG